MNSIRAQNAIIDLLRGVVNDVQVTDLKVHSTADPTLEDSDSEELKGGAPAIEAVENVFLAGGNPTVVSERNEFAEIGAKMEAQNQIEGGDAEHESDKHDEEGSTETVPGTSNKLEEKTSSESAEEEEKEVVEADDFEPDDLDGKEEIQKDDEGDKVEDNFESDHDNEEEEETDEMEMKGGATIQRVNMITADLKFPFILKSRRK